jgi:hypothetical protein
MQQHAEVAPADQSSPSMGSCQSAVVSVAALKDAPGLDEQLDAITGQEGPRVSRDRSVQQQQCGRLGQNTEAKIQSFLDSASSQLTEHGLVSLHQVFPWEGDAAAWASAVPVE